MTPYGCDTPAPNDCTMKASSTPSPPLKKKKNSWIQISEHDMINGRPLSLQTVLFFSNKVLKTHLNFLHTQFGKSVTENCYQTVLKEFPRDCPQPSQLSPGDQTPSCLQMIPF